MGLTRLENAHATYARPKNTTYKLLPFLLYMTIYFRYANIWTCVPQYLLPRMASPLMFFRFLFVLLQLRQLKLYKTFLLLYTSPIKRPKILEFIENKLTPLKKSNMLSSGKYKYANSNNALNVNGSTNLRTVVPVL